MSSKKFNPFKDFQSDQIQGSSHKIFTAHCACRNANLNLTIVTGTINGFIFQIFNSFIESWGGYAWPALTVTLHWNSDSKFVQVQYVAENGWLNFRGFFTTKVIKSNVKPHVKFDAQKVNYAHLPLLPPVVMAVIWMLNFLLVPFEKGNLKDSLFDCTF